MATTKTKAKAKKPAAKPAKRKSSAKVNAANQEYSEVTWLLMSVWLALIVIFLGLVIYKLYLNN